MTDIIPHRAPMVLIDRVLSCNEKMIQTEVVISKDSFGLQNESVPAWFGIEYMAQSIAAFNGIQFSTIGKPEIGFLVGARQYKAHVKQFNLGERLIVKVEPSFIIENSGSFTCQIINATSNTEILIAEASLTTFKPNSEFIEKLKQEQSQ